MGIFLNFGALDENLYSAPEFLSLMISRFRMFNVDGGLVVERSIEVSSRISPGIFEFTVERPDEKELAALSLLGVSNGVLKGLVPLAWHTVTRKVRGTFEDVYNGERLSGLLVIISNNSLKRASIRVGSVELDGGRAYVVRKEIRSDVLFLDDMKPGTVVTFRGAPLVFWRRHRGLSQPF